MKILLLIGCLLVIHCTSAQPQPRHLEQITYDPVRKNLIVFGGVEKDGEKWIEPSQLFEWNENHWKEFRMDGPIGRRGHSIVYDPSQKVTWLLGGIAAAKKDDSVLFDIWSWNGKRWQLKDSMCPLKTPEACYDLTKKRILVYGDAYEKTVAWRGGMNMRFELWQWKNDVWEKLSADGPVQDGPSAVVFHEARKSLITLNWEAEQVVTWEWVGEQWKKSACPGACPQKRSRYSLAYNPLDRNIYFFGGRDDSKNFLNDFWQWDGVQWTKIEYANGPPNSASHNMVFTKEFGLLLYGGVTDKGQLTNTLWQWKNGAWALLFQK
jgi:hypothetical protein